MRPLYIYIAVVLWALFGFVIVYFARQHMETSLSDYFVANKTVGGFISGMTYSATTYSAFMMVGLVGLAYTSGVAALGFEMTYLMFTIILLYLFAPKFWLAGKKYNYITPPELLADRYENKYVGVVASVLALTMLIPYASVQLMGVGYLFQGLSGGEIPFMGGVLIMAAFSGITALWAGFRSVSWTDAFQAMTMIITSIFLLFFVFFHFFGSPSGFISTISTGYSELLEINWDLPRFIGLSLPWAFFALSNPQVSQRMFVSENVSSLKNMIIYFAIFGFIYTIITTLLGFSVRGIPLELSNPDNAMPELLARVPTALSLLVFVGIFAAATSTLGSIVLTLSSISVLNIANSLNPKISENSELIIGRLVVGGLLIVCILFAQMQLDLITILSSMASGGLLVSVPAFIGAFYWKKGSDLGAISSMAGGGILTAFLYISGWYPFKIWPPVWGLLTSSLLFIVISLHSKKPSNAEKFIDFINEKSKEMNF
ncbi:MAG: sodium:solute symporter family protein [Candidatus Hadarchaeia archaeon]